ARRQDRLPRDYRGRRIDGKRDAPTVAAAGPAGWYRPREALDGRTSLRHQPRDQERRVLQHRTRASRGWQGLRVDVGNDGRRPGAAASHARDRVPERGDDRRRACRYPARCSKGLSRPVAIPPAVGGRISKSRRQIPTALLLYDGTRLADRCGRWIDQDDRPPIIEDFMLSVE